ncbi:hypothetical protein VTK56DRAFT_9434 [Thermocarpiscus australiensis]
MPFYSILSRFAPRTHMNTLDSGPASSTKPSRSSPSRAPAQPPAPKRQKQAGYTEARFRGPVEDIVDVEQDARSRTERHGSQASFAHSGSPGLLEFQSVEASAKHERRSNRRSRRSPAENNPPSSTLLGRSRMSNETVEDFDELAPETKPAVCRQRTARLLSITSGIKPNTMVYDAADRHILQRHVQPKKHTQGLNRGKKRSSDEITDDGDELVEETNGKGASKTSATLLAADSAKRDPPSVSRRGDLNPTRWKKQPEKIPTIEARVEAAVCQPNLRYLGAGGQSPCILRPTGATELRAFTPDDNPAEPYEWLKITKKAKTLNYHPESRFIKISQSTDQASIQIGALMVLKFFSQEDASRVADWARETLRINVLQEADSTGLLRVYDKVSQAVSQAPARTSSARRQSHEVLECPSLGVRESRTTEIRRLDNAPTSSRTPIRNQMKVTAPTPAIPRAEPSNTPVPSESRSLRSRQDVGRAQKVEAPTPPVVRRWTEQNPDWSKNWEVPLVFHRTRVDKEDIPRLDEGQCLNDNLIGFGLRYLFDEYSGRHKDLNKRVYLHNSFFYEKLKSGRGTINYDGVKSWTAKVDLLSYDYIIVPVNEHFHWWVAIICNPGRLDPDHRRLPGKIEGSSGNVEKSAGAAQPDQGVQDEVSSDVEMTDATEKPPLRSPRDTPMDELNGLSITSPREARLVKSDIVDLVSDDKHGSIDLTTGARTKHGGKSGSAPRRYNLEDPRVITLDSLGSSHSHAVSHLKKYLLAEFEHKRKKVITDVPQQLGMKAVNIPEQDNFCDCGVYLLGYIQEFVRDPEKFIQTLLRKERPDWQFDPSHLRSLWRDTILCEHKKYQEKQLAERRRKRGVSATKRTTNGSTERNGDKSRANSELTNTSDGKRSGTMDRSEQPASANTANPARNRDVQEVADSDAEPTPRGLRQSAGDQTRSPAAVLGGSPQQRPSRQESPEEVFLLSPQEDDILPSIEPREDSPELQFIPKLSTSPPRPTDHGFLAEIDPKTFYKSSSTESKKAPARHALSSPGVGQRGGTAKAQPTHTRSHFDVPEVQNAELVRQTDSIDLTDQP